MQLVFYVAMLIGCMEEDTACSMYGQFRTLYSETPLADGRGMLWTAWSPDVVAKQLPCMLLALWRKNSCREPKFETELIWLTARPIHLLLFFYSVADTFMLPLLDPHDMFLHIQVLFWGAPCDAARAVQPCGGNGQLAVVVREVPCPSTSPCIVASMLVQENLY